MGTGVLEGDNKSTLLFPDPRAGGMEAGPEFQGQQASAALKRVVA